MPIEFTLLQDKPLPLEKCPKCGDAPFDPFMRGCVQRRKKKFVFWGDWDYCALICWKCKEIVGHESPPKAPS